MNEERLGSPATFARALASHIASLGDGAHGLPEDGDLGRLVDLGFFASLHEDEARRTELSLAWMSRPRDCAAVVELRRPVIATPKAIARLAPAVQREATSLAVRREGDELVIWALLEHGAAAELPLTLRSLAPGVLRVDYLGIPRALYARGEILLLGDAPSVRSPARRLTAAFVSWAGSADPATHVDPRAATVTRIAARALEHGHGGMILLVPSGAEPRGVRIHYEVGHGADVLATRHADLVDGSAAAECLARIAASPSASAGGPVDGRARAERLYSEAIDLVARLTATDNAVLLDTDLRLLGFGAQVIEGEAPLRTFTHEDPYTSAIHVDDISTFKGTRHPAGVVFCLRQEGEAAAIIASQDGRLSLVVKDAGGAVEVLGSYERGFGWR